VVSKKERLQAAIAGERADRLPVALWRHFPVDDQSPEELSESIAGFQDAFDFDLIKVTPASSYCLVDWGVQDEWLGNTEGTRTYTHRVIEDPEDWRALEPLDPSSGEMARQLRCLELLRERFGPEMPIIETIFNPLSQAKNLAGEGRMLEHLRQDLDSVREGLKTIAGTSIAFIEASKERGIDGIFYAVQHASDRYFHVEEYLALAGDTDREILESAQDLWLNILHLHGDSVHFELGESYPVQIVNWHDRESEVSLAAGQARIPGAVCGGVGTRTLSLGSPAEVRAEAEDAIRSVQRRGLVLGTGCVTPIISPRANIRALRDAVHFV
jgi:uroporphyrinogen decarboxylase